ncbi:hypothetical protein SLS56_008045 [Neofusicoccum ribis]|uniref:Retrotransposon Copia-like N-terminal domain-containing protein n=1 Tax=Neofusicoccum ribis TaxID=45134 RepID=A0ABR3SM72_9PEZI
MDIPTLFDDGEPQQQVIPNIINIIDIINMDDPAPSRNVSVTILRIDGSNFNEWHADIRRCFGGTDYWRVLSGESPRPNEPENLATETVAEYNARCFDFHTWHQLSTRACDVLLNTIDPDLWALFDKSMTGREVFNIIRLRCNPEEKAKRKDAWTSITWDGRDFRSFWHSWSTARDAYMNTGPHIDRAKAETSQFLAAISPAAARYEYIRTWKEVIEEAVTTSSQKNPDVESLAMGLSECVKIHRKKQRSPGVGSSDG